MGFVLGKPVRVSSVKGVSGQWFSVVIHYQPSDFVVKRLAIALEMHQLVMRV